MDYFLEILFTLLWFGIPTAICTGIYSLIRFKTNIPEFIFRKILHITAIIMMIPIIIVPIHWWISEIVIGIITIVIIAILLIFQRFEFYSKLFIEKRKYEVLISISIFFLLVASLIAFFWGYRNNKYYVLISLFSWGLGDAAASIFGHLFGKHKISGKYIEGIKSIEGSIACFIFSFIITFILLLTLIHMVWWLSILTSLCVGIVVTFMELFTKKGLDNLTCPISAGIVLFLFSLINIL